MTILRMDNVAIVVEDLDAAITFFTELGLTLEGRMPVEGEWAVESLEFATNEWRSRCCGHLTEIAVSSYRV